MANCNVTHIIWGHGRIIFKDEKYVKVMFDDHAVGEKTFVYPDAFSKYIKYEDKECQRIIEGEIKAIYDAQAEKSERLRKERLTAAAAMIEKEKNILSKKKKAMAYSRKRAEKLRAKSSKEGGDSNSDNEADPADAPDLTYEENDLDSLPVENEE